jgi:uncharacterized protein YdeI (YjbR/CyaY-like superfamily)
MSAMAKPLRFHAPDRAAWTAWLEQHHATAAEISLVFYRKASGKPSIAYDEAVEEALCFGWIDGIKHKLDDQRYTYRFTPRRPGSKWSAINKQRIAALEAAGKLRPAGQAAIAAARSGGSWDLPARSAVPDQLPTELAAALRASPRAKAAFDKLPPSHRRQWQLYVREAKQTETRARRAARAVTQLAAGKADPRKL